MPSTTVIKSLIRSPGKICCHIQTPLSKAKSKKNPVDQPDSRKRRDYTPDAVDEQIPPQKAGGVKRAVSDPAERQRHESDNDQSIENYGREHGALRRMQAHD